MQFVTVWTKAYYFRLPLELIPEHQNLDQTRDICGELNEPSGLERELYVGFRKFLKPL